MTHQYITYIFKYWFKFQFIFFGIIDLCCFFRCSLNKTGSFEKHLTTNYLSSLIYLQYINR